MPSLQEIWDIIEEKHDNRLYAVVHAESFGGSPEEKLATASAFINQANQIGYEKALKQSAAYNTKSNLYQQAITGKFKDSVEAKDYENSKQITDQVLQNPKSRTPYTNFENIKAYPTPSWVADMESYKDIDRQRYYIPKVKKPVRFNLTELNPFSIPETQAAEPISLEQIWQGIKKEPSLEQTLEQIWQEEKPPITKRAKELWETEPRIISLPETLPITSIRGFQGLPQTPEQEQFNIKAGVTALSKFFEGGARTSQAVGTTIAEALSHPTYKQITPGKYEISKDQAHLGKAFLAGFAPELYPDYPKENITTLGNMVRKTGEGLFNLYGTPEEAQKFYKSPEWHKNLAILGTTAGRTTFDFLSMIPDIYTNPATYLTLKAIGEAVKPLNKINILKKLETEYKMPERITIPAQRVRDIQQGVQNVLTTEEEKQLITILGQDNWKKALTQGIDAEVPARAISTLTDRPWWTKVKQFFGKPATEPIITMDVAGKPQTTGMRLVWKGEIAPRVTEAPIVPLTPITTPTEGIAGAPGIIQPSPIPLAIRLNTGAVITDPTTALHSDIITKQGINPDDVQDVGILDEKGEYQPTKLPDEKGGAPLETLPAIPWQQNLEEAKLEIKRLHKGIKKALDKGKGDEAVVLKQQIKLIQDYSKMKSGMPGFPKPKPTYNTFIGYVKQSGGLNLGLLLEHKGMKDRAELIKNYPIYATPGLVTPNGQDLEEFYQETAAIIPGFGTPDVDALPGGKAQYVIEYLEQSPGKFIENTLKFEKQLQQDYKKRMEGKNVRPEDEELISREQEKIVSNQTFEEVARIQTEPTYATQLLDKFETTRDINEYVAITEELDKIGQDNLTEDELARYKELLSSKSKQFTGMPEITGEKPATITPSKGLEDMFGAISLEKPGAQLEAFVKKQPTEVKILPYPGWLSEHYNKPTWIELWKQYPHLQEEMLEYQRRVQNWRKQIPGVQYSMEPGQTPEQFYFKWEGPEEGRITAVLPAIEKTYNVTELMSSGQLTQAQLIDALKKAAATFSKDIAGLTRVLVEDFADLLPPVTITTTPLAIPNIGRTGTIVNQAFIEMYNYRFNPLKHEIKRWLNNNCFAAVYRTIMKFRVATANHTDAARAAEYKKVENLLTVKLGRPPTIYEIANEVQWAKEPKEEPKLNPQQQHTLFGTGEVKLLKNGRKSIANLLKVAEIRDLIAFGEGKVSMDVLMAKERAPATKEAQWEQNYGDPQYSISEEDYCSVLNGKGIGISMGPKPKVIPPVTATNETITFPKEGNRHIDEIYEREIGPVLQMSKRFRRFAGAYYGHLGKGSGLVRVKSLTNLKILSHETGHFLDDVLGKFPIEKDLRDELIAVTKYHVPFEEKYIYGPVSKRTGKPTRKQTPYTAYRRSRSELFADYVNVYITEPDKAKELAPVFTAIVENQILKDKEFAYIVKKMREFNTEMQILIDYTADLRAIPDLQPDLKGWVEKGNLIGNLWRGKIADKVWNWWTKHYDDFARLKWPWYGKNWTEKRGLDDLSFEILRQRKHLISGQSLRINELLVQPVSKYSKEDQEWIYKALHRFIILDPKVTPTIDLPPSLLKLPASEQMKFWEKIALHTEDQRKEWAIWGNELRKLGLLSDLTYFNNAGIYMPALYEKHEYDRLLKMSSGTPFLSKALRINLQRLKHKLTDEEMGRKSLEAQMGTWPSQKAKIEEDWTKEELIELGRKIRAEILKEIKTVAYPMAKCLPQMIQMTYTAKALNAIATIPGIIGTKNMEGYIQLPEGKSLGNLAGQWVPRNHADEINSFNEKVGEIMAVWNAGNVVFKAFKVAWQTAAWCRNLVTNDLQFFLNGIPTWNPVVKLRGLKVFCNKNHPAYTLLRDRGLYRHTYAQEEMLKDLSFRLETETGNPLLIVAKWATKVFNAPGHAYGAIEDACKTIGAVYILDHGGTPEQAIKFADMTLFDYTSTSKAVAGARKTMWPFVTWSAKVFPQLMRAAIRHPEKYLFIIALLLVSNAMSRKALGITQKEEESMKPEWFKHQPCLLRPWRDENGQVQWIGLSYFLPWGGWMTPIKGTIIPQPLQVGNAFSILYNAYVQNYDPFGGEIGKEWMTEKEKRQAKNKYVFQSFMPSLAGRGGENIIKGIRQAPEDYDQYGRKPLLPQILSAELFGVRFIAGGETTTRVVNFVNQQKKAAIEVNDKAQKAWENYYRTPNLITLKAAEDANEKVEPASRVRIKHEANQNIKLEKNVNRRFEELSRRKRMQFKEFEEKLK